MRISVWSSDVCSSDLYGEMLRIEPLAEIAGMSEASFHRHFKAATAMSPLQYQKSLRLQAARRLLATGSEANRAAFAVGYESASQFSREYRRAFGIQIGRESCRERVCKYVLSSVVAESLKKKKETNSSVECKIVIQLNDTKKE